MVLVLSPAIFLENGASHWSLNKNLQMIDELAKDPSIRYIERNEAIYENSEHVPPGIAQALGGLPVNAVGPGRGVASGSCSDPDSFRVAILDGGIDLSHYDFWYCGLNDANAAPDPDRDTRCIGQAFLTKDDLDDGQDWYNSKRAHGMHVAGTIAASWLNSAGISGMIGDEQLCLVIGRVFGDTGSADVAQVAQSIIWAANVGAKVINMSFGTASRLTTITDAIQYAYGKGACALHGRRNHINTRTVHLSNHYILLTCFRFRLSLGGLCWVRTISDYTSPCNYFLLHRRTLTKSQNKHQKRSRRRPSSPCQLSSQLR